MFRPSTGEWHVLRSSDFGYEVFRWGISTDRPIPADYDGDGKADIAVYRESNLFAYILRSSDLTPAYYQYGSPGDILQVGDYDGDFVADLAIYRPSVIGWWTTARATLGAAATFGGPGVIPTSSVVKPE